ncbi:MAG: glycoside hydrolase family 3 N-terminal domain-containing protein [Candidatus Izemoplasmatales bacterium]|nr:glycoside hydrolase family 3 N-terminal domain-containing protein [Candidatus Izemoplasmatales bacterium]
MNPMIEKAKEILNNMTLKERIGQMTQLPPNFFLDKTKIAVSGTLRYLDLVEEQVYTAGSILGIGGPDEMIELQKLYLDNATHKVPLLFMADVIHGYKTIFPVPIALASSFNPNVAFLAARVSAKETFTAGIHVVFSPMCDLTRDPRWGRVVEGFGEDVYLSGEMAKACVLGYTNNGKFGEGSVASCIKHFAGYGASESGRDYNTVDLSRLSLFRDYLPAYKKALDAGADLVMTSFNTLDGVPATINPFLLKTVLRDKWKSEAITIADYDALNQVIEHGGVENQKDAALKGIKAGLDIEMSSSVYMNYLEGLINEQLVLKEEIDKIVLKIIALKVKLGIFDNPYSGADIRKEKELTLCKEHLEAAKKVALESTVLLENNGVLPLKSDVKIALIGPFATSKAVIGPWSWRGRSDIHSSLKDVLDNNLVFVSNKYKIDEYTKEELDIINSADVCIMAIGEDASLSGEAHSRSDIHLPDNQEDFYQEIKRVSKKTIVLVFGGRPLLLSELKSADAMMMCWFLGSSSSEAIKDLLFGLKSPSGKLPMSFPMNVGQIPVYYNHLNTGRPTRGNDNNIYTSKYLDVVNEPLYPFGYGLSYGSFKYSNLELSNDLIKENETLKIKITITNESDFSGNEVVQVYIRDYVADIVRPVKELKKFKKVYLFGKTKKVIEFELSIDDLSYYDNEGNVSLESGKMAIFVGGSSDNCLSKDFNIVLGGYYE